MQEQADGRARDTRFQRHTWNTRKPSITVVISIVPVTAIP